jgi:molybdopterin/thiamine biosynthesis adenylyltransferase
MPDLPELTDEELLRYDWQLASEGFGALGQRRLKGASVFVSRIGGVGGAAAMQLAAAGVGRLVLAHGGNLRLDDLNRQMLMSTADVGRPRIESALARLRAINPHVEVRAVGENVDEQNAAGIMRDCDVIVSAAPLFGERMLMNREAVRGRKPLVDCAMYDLEARLLVVLPGSTACLACLYPDDPPHWRRRFPVFGAVASTIGSLAAMEAIKLVAQLGEPMAGKLLCIDHRTLSFQSFKVQRRAECPVCGGLG